MPMTAGHLIGQPQRKWSKEFALDLGERVLSTFLQALLGLIVASGTTPVEWQTIAWPVLGIPTVVALIKGLLANMANAESGASMLPSPPVTVDDERGESVVSLAIAVLVIVVVVVILFRLL